MLMLTSVSVKLAPVTLKPLVFARVKVMVELLLDTIVAGRKTLLTVGTAVPAATTLRIAVFEAGLDVVLELGPSTLLVTGTVTVQLPVAGMVSPVILRDVSPAPKLLPPAPAHVPPAGPATETVMPLGNVSMKDPAIGEPLAFARVKVMVEVPPEAMVAGKKTLVIVGTAGSAHGGTVIVSPVVDTVPPNARALPPHCTVLSIVIPAASITVPWKVEFAPSVVAPPGVHQTSQADGPLNVTTEPATVVSAPVILKMYVPLPPRVIPPVPIEAAPSMQ